ncbi:MAG TPA: aminoglycoside phosphotransferase family protein [Streptosporangiaceae bacterium]|nr:aminoglycoside phosphotransferase family protein [Streptosporangiaceae bacterium]
MPDFVVAHTQRWIDRFTRQGHEVEPLAAGVEGAIYDLGGDLIAKVWRQRYADDLQRMQSFYADVAAAGLPFATPEIFRVETVDGTSVTYERKLSGEPLQHRMGIDDPKIGLSNLRCIVDVLGALADVPATATMRQLAVLDESQPLWAHASSFPAALTGLLGRRFAQFGDVIRTHLQDYDRRYAALLDRLTLLDAQPDTVIHGDLFGGNILVDDQSRPLAVLDFGFLTTAGDPRLDAAITACVVNMYGPHAQAITQDLTARIAQDLHYSSEVLLIYQAAYAAATSNAFTADGSDGHFAWCMAQLRRADVSEVLGL